MVKRLDINFKLIVNFLLLAVINVNGNAQKLPKIQQASKWAAGNIKIDAKTTDWNDKFEAYNAANHFYYTVANDDQNLYLIMRTSDAYSNEKALFGITFTINLPTEKGKKSKDNVVIIFPTVVEVKKREPIRNATLSFRRLKNDTSSTAKRKIDSLTLFANNAMNDSFKEIGIGGIKEIADPVISIYNTNGLKVAAQFNESMQYTYELAIPLKYLGTFINRGQKFSYNIKMNGMPEKSPGSPYPPPMVMPDGANFMDADVSFVMFPTDFWSEYTLAKKP